MADAAPVEQPTILVVEDERDIMNLVVLALQANGFSVLKASRAEEALRISNQHEGPIDLLLTDIVLPGDKLGGQLAEELAKERQGLKVLYMSGYSEDAAINHGFVRPGVRFLAKPFAAEDMITTVRAALGRGPPGRT